MEDHMKQLAPDLWQTSAHELAENVYTHAYLLTRPSGNVLIYGIGEAQQHDLDAIDALGGIALQVLSHRDEASPALDQVRQRFGSRLAYHEADAHAIEAQAEADLFVTADCDEPLLDGIEVFATPGHTPGSVSLRYESPHGSTYLFTGDTIFPSQGGWATAVYPQIESDAEALVDSLNLLRGIDADVVLSSASVGDTSVAEMTPEQWHGIIDHRVGRLREQFLRG